MAPHRSNRKGDLGNYRPMSSAADIDNIFLTEEGWVYRHFKGDPRDPNTRFWDEIIVAGEVKLNEERPSRNPADYGNVINNAPCLDTLNATPDRKYLGLGATPEQNSTDGYVADATGFDTGSIPWEEVIKKSSRTIGYTDQIFDVEYPKPGDGGGTTPPGDKIIGNVVFRGPKNPSTGRDSEVENLIPGSTHLFTASTSTNTVESSSILHTFSCEPSDTSTVNGNLVEFDAVGDYVVTCTSTSTDPDWDQDTQTNDIGVTIETYPPPPGPFELEVWGITLEEPYNKDDYIEGEVVSCRYLTNLYDSGYEDKITKVEWFNNGNLVPESNYVDYNYKHEYANITVEQGVNEIRAVVYIDRDGTEISDDHTESLTAIETHPAWVLEMVSFTSSPYTDEIPYGETTSVFVKFKHRSMRPDKFNYSRIIDPSDMDTGEITAKGDWNFVGSSEVEIADPDGPITEVTFEYTLKNDIIGGDSENVNSYIKGIPLSEPPYNKYLESISANLNGNLLGTIIFGAGAITNNRTLRTTNTDVTQGEYCPSDKSTAYAFNEWTGNCQTINVTHLDGQRLWDNAGPKTNASITIKSVDGTVLIEGSVKSVSKKDTEPNAYITLDKKGGDSNYNGSFKTHPDVIIEQTGLFD